MPRIAAAAYPLSPLADWAAYEEKLDAWVGDAAAGGGELLLFPEYGGAEIATIGGRVFSDDDLAVVDAITSNLSKADEILAEMAARHGVWILAGSAPIRDGGRIINRARLISPNGPAGHQDKMIPTPWEREAMGMSGGAALTLFETPLGSFGVPICYDSEFPLISRALIEAGADFLLLPSCTETKAGYTRTRVGGMARALEGQCWVAHAPLIGGNIWAGMVETNTGTAAIYCPSDIGFAPNGVTAEGKRDMPGWIIAECDAAPVAHVREAGGVRNYAHWPEQNGRLKVIRSEHL